MADLLASPEELAEPLGAAGARRGRRDPDRDVLRAGRRSEERDRACARVLAAEAARGRAAAPRARRSAGAARLRSASRRSRALLGPLLRDLAGGPDRGPSRCGLRFRPPATRALWASACRRTTALRELLAASRPADGHEPESFRRARRARTPTKSARQFSERDRRARRRRADSPAGCRPRSSTRPSSRRASCARAPFPGRPC